jgi:hypothetical protein
MKAVRPDAILHLAVQHPTFDDQRSSAARAEGGATGRKKTPETVKFGDVEDGSRVGVVYLFYASAAWPN